MVVLTTNIGLKGSISPLPFGTDTFHLSGKRATRERSFHMVRGNGSIGKNNPRKQEYPSESVRRGRSELRDRERFPEY